MNKIKTFDKIDDIMFETLLNGVDDLIFFKDKDLKYLGCNEAFLNLIGKESVEEILGKSDFDILPNGIAKTCNISDKEMIEENDIKISYEWIPRPSGDMGYHSTKKIPFKYNETDIGVLGITRDITELYLNEQKFKAQAYIDELTQLNNRKSYNERLKELISLKKRYNKSFSMLMYDIDNFKNINDTYGHIVGDTVLVKMSELVKSHLRENDYIFRIGGEEFVILLPETNLEDTKKVASKISKSIEKDLKYITDKTITVSMGVSEVNESDNEDTIFKRVDDLLYKSKNSGKNKVSY